MEFKTTFKKLVFSLLGSMIILLPTVLAYPAILPAYDLYGVFVEMVFGGFWLSVIGLTAVMFLMMGPIGGMSQWSTIMYCLFFVFSMAVGYTYMPFILPVWVFIMAWSVYQMFRWINTASAA